MTLFEIGMLIILATFCVMCVVNRICKCVEHRATAKAFAASVGKSSTLEYAPGMTAFARTLEVRSSDINGTDGRQ